MIYCPDNNDSITTYPVPPDQDGMVRQPSIQRTATDNTVHEIPPAAASSSTTTGSRIPLNPIIKVLTNRNVTININWGRIAKNFEQLYRQTFSISKKAHFDCLPEDWNQDDKVVDGAKSKWCLPLLLDAVMYILEKDRLNLSYRRTFNQAKILQECILQELKEYYPNIYAEVLKQNEKKPKKFQHNNTFHSSAAASSTLSIASQSNFPISSVPISGVVVKVNSSMNSTYPPYSSSSVTETFPRHDVVMYPTLSPSDILEEYYQCRCVQLEGVSKEWSHLQKLKMLMFEDPTVKSRKKFISIINTLTNHPILSFYKQNILKIVKIVVYKAIFIYPCCATFSNPIVRKKSSSGDDDGSAQSSSSDIAHHPETMALQIQGAKEPSGNAQSQFQFSAGFAKPDLQMLANNIGNNGDMNGQTKLQNVDPVAKKRDWESYSDSHSQSQPNLTSGYANYDKLMERRQPKKQKINLLELIDFTKLSKLDHASLQAVLMHIQDKEVEVPSPPQGATVVNATSDRAQPIVPQSTMTLKTVEPSTGQPNLNDLATLQSMYYWFERQSSIPLLDPAQNFFPSGFLPMQQQQQQQPIMPNLVSSNPLMMANLPYSNFGFNDPLYGFNQPQQQQQQQFPNTMIPNPTDNYRLLEFLQSQLQYPISSLTEQQQPQPQAGRSPSQDH